MPDPHGKLTAKGQRIEDAARLQRMADELDGVAYRVRGVEGRSAREAAASLRIIAARLQQR